MATSFVGSDEVYHVKIACSDDDVWFKLFLQDETGDQTGHIEVSTSVPTEVDNNAR